MVRRTLPIFRRGSIRNGRKHVENTRQSFVPRLRPFSSWIASTVSFFLSFLFFSSRKNNGGYYVPLLSVWSTNLSRARGVRFQQLAFSSLKRVALRVSSGIRSGKRSQWTACAPNESITRAAIEWHVLSQKTAPSIKIEFFLHPPSPAAPLSSKLLS